MFTEHVEHVQKSVVFFQYCCDCIAIPGERRESYHIYLTVSLSAIGHCSYHSVVTFSCKIPKAAKLEHTIVLIPFDLKF